MHDGAFADIPGSGRPSWLCLDLAYKANWEEELQRRKDAGLTGPEPVPHPEDIFLDFATGAVEIRGPMTREDKELFESAGRVEKLCEDRIAELEDLIEEEPENEELKEQLKVIRRVLRKARKARSG